MKCKRQPPYLLLKPTPIADLWEIRLSESHWKALVNAARQRRCSYSNITRYCIFRLAERQNLAWRKCLTQAALKVKADAPSGREGHRHLVCFYGEDLKLVRLAAMTLGINVSAFVRLALFLFLPRIALENHSKKSVSAKELFYLGIKRWQHVHHTAVNNFHIPQLRRFTFSNFFPWQWWPPAIHIP